MHASGLTNLLPLCMYEREGERDKYYTIKRKIYKEKAEKLGIHMNEMNQTTRKELE